MNPNDFDASFAGLVNVLPPCGACVERGIDTRSRPQPFTPLTGAWLTDAARASSLIAVLWPSKTLTPRQSRLARNLNLSAKDRHSASPSTRANWLCANRATGCALAISPAADRGGAVGDDGKSDGRRPPTARYGRQPTNCTARSATGERLRPNTGPASTKNNIDREPPYRRLHEPRGIPPPYKHSTPRLSTWYFRTGGERTAWSPMRRPALPSPNRRRAALGGPSPDPIGSIPFHFRPVAAS